MIIAITRKGGLENNGCYRSVSKINTIGKINEKNCEALKMKLTQREIRIRISVMFVGDCFRTICIGGYKSWKLWE